MTRSTTRLEWLGEAQTRGREVRPTRVKAGDLRLLGDIVADLLEGMGPRSIERLTAYSVPVPPAPWDGKNKEKGI